jgi:hypothetical protein
MEIKDYPNYLIYDDGRVWSKNRKKFMEHQLDYLGYYVVGLRNPKKKIMKVHRLIAQYYIPNPNNKKVVDHINRIKTDNRIENLRWVTHTENNLNRGLLKNNTTGYENISFINEKLFRIIIKRYKLIYYKNCKTLNEAIVQRDLMLSMFI